MIKVEKISLLLNGIERLCDESSMAIPEAYSGIESIEKELENFPVTEIYVHDKINEIIKNKIKSFLKVNLLSGEYALNGFNDYANPLLIKFQHSFLPRTKKISESAPACIILFISAEMLSEDKTLIQNISDLTNQHQFCYIYSDKTLHTDVLNLFKCKNGLVKAETFDTLPPSIDDWIIDQGFIRLLEISHAVSICHSIENIIELLDILFCKETDHLKVNRFINQQQAVKFSRNIQSTGFVNDLMTEVKTKLQNNIYLFEKGFNERMDDCLRLNGGVLFKELVQLIESLDSFEETKLHKHVAVVIPKQFEENILSHIHERLDEEFTSDLIILKDHLQLMLQEIEKLMKHRNLPNTAFNTRFVPDTAIQKVFDNNIRFEKPYKGERPSRGAIEYLMAARSYYMILAMTISTFGLSFIRNITVIMIPVTIILMGIGALNVYKDVEKDSEQFLKKELERAKDYLLMECKRILLDIRKDWSAIITSNLREQLTNFINQLEPVAKEHQGMAGEKMLTEKKKLQRQLQAIDTQEKKLMLMEKKRQMLQADVVKLQAELNQELITTHYKKII